MTGKSILLMRYRKAYEWGRARLEMAKVPEAALDARLLLEYICNTTRNDLYANSERELSESENDSYEEIIRQRAKRIPLQHLTGEQDFMGLTFMVNDKVLIPRQDTEILVEEALICVEDADSVLDLCTGSGCVLLSVMKYKNNIQGVGTDISQDALSVARANYERLMSSINGKAEFICSDLFDKVEGQFDVILSNPPYIKTEVIDTLQEEVKDHDPMLALDGGMDGLIFYKRIADEAANYLKNEGKILLEIGHDQAEAVSFILKEAGFTEINVIKDLSGNDRVVKGKKYV